MSELLEGSLRSLGLKGMLEAYQEVGEAARRESMSYEKYLEELLERERQERTERRVERLPAPVAPASGEDAGELRSGTAAGEAQRAAEPIARGGVRPEERERAGLRESGKREESSWSVRFGQELIGRGHAVLFRPCSLLVQDLLRAKRDLELAKALKKLRHFEVLVIDDIGYVQQSREEMEVLFALLADRYERGSVMVTSNLAFSEWEKIFKDPMTTAAAIDRLVHHSVILELNLPSYRLEQAKKRKKGS